MPHSRRSATGMLRGLLLAIAVVTPVSAQAPAVPQPESPVRLFRLVTMRGDVILGLTPREIAALGVGSEVERVARRIAQDGQITAWRYEVTRAPDGRTQLGARVRVAVLRQDALTVEPYAPALPVAAPPESP